MIQKTKLKKEFNEAGIQMTSDAVKALDREVTLMIKQWVRKTKEGNVKRLTAELIWVPLGKLLDK